MDNQEFDADVVVIGGGMVGALLACALAKPKALKIGVSVQTKPLKIVLVDTERPQPFAADPDPVYDLRVSALSIASRRMLEAVDAWQGIESRRVCRYRDLSVWDGEAQGRTDFHAADIGAAELGYIVENRVIQLALWDQISALAGIECLCPATLESINTDSSGVTLSVAGATQRIVRARLVVGADGSRSAVREQAGIAVNRHRYDQHALVANVTTTLPQQHITWQRFVPTGPQAMLPLCGARASLVWYHNDGEINRLKALDEAAFITELSAAFPTELGDIESVQARASFPITKAHAEHYTAQRTALAGDAAHTVHPLAGQGVNIGLLDAAALAEVVLKAHHAGRDIGATQVLARYERWRRFDNSVMIEALDGIHRAFLPQPMWLRQLRSAGLNVVNRVSPVKRRVMHHAMGLSGDLPQLARL